MIRHVLWTVCTPLPGCETLEERCADLERQLGEVCGSPDRLVFVRVFFSDISNQFPPLQTTTLYTRWLQGCALSWVEQPPLDGSKLTLLAAYAPQGVDVWREGTDDRMCMRIAHAPEVFFQRVRFSADEAAALSVDGQTEEAFRRHIDWLAGHGLTLEADCQRTWIYVRDIDNNYADVVAARNRVFAREGLDAHYIASTGIGGAGHARHAYVGMDFLSVGREALQRVDYLQALDYLNPTREYGVAFERGTALTFSDGGRTLLVSGTASIDNRGRCLYRGDVIAQTERLFLNIEKLLENGGATLADMRWMTVYLRDVCDYTRVEAWLRSHFPHVPFVVTEARVCRPEWLIEVECVAEL